MKSPETKALLKMSRSSLGVVSEGSSSSRDRTSGRAS